MEAPSLNEIDWNIESEDITTDIQEIDDKVSSYGDDETTDDYRNGSQEEDYIDNQNAEDGVSRFLKLHGVSDPSKIKYDTGNGEIEVDFNDLTSEEQMNILDELSSNDLSDDEVVLLNQLRKDGVSFDDLINREVNNRMQAMSAQQTAAQSYYIDEYEDDQLYVADSKSRYPNLTDDELIEKLELAKQNPTTYKKEVSALRAYYKAQEEQEMEAERQLAVQSYKDAQDQIVQAISDFNGLELDNVNGEIDALEIEDRDKEVVLDYLLKTDGTGRSKFMQDVTKPENLVELAWYKLYGQQALSNMTKYWKGEIRKEQSYRAQLEKQIAELTGPRDTYRRNTAPPVYNTGGQSKIRDMASISDNIHL